MYWAGLLQEALSTVKYAAPVSAAADITPMSRGSRPADRVARTRRAVFASFPLAMLTPCSYFVAATSLPVLRSYQPVRLLSGIIAAMELVNIERIQAARKLLREVTRVTPMEHARDLRRLQGGPVYLKCENLQRTGSFKIRGAYTRIHGLTEEERARGVVAASAGNHAQGVALAASLLGAKATVFMPGRVPLPKLDATRGYGADVHLHGDVLEETLAEAVAFAERTGAVFIHPFDHEDIIAGQGTVGLELLEQVPDAATVLVPAGGGGLVAGVACAVKEMRPDVRIVAVQAEDAAAFPASLAAGKPVLLDNPHTMADGI